MFRRKPRCRQCLHTVLLSQPGPGPSGGENKACASLLGAKSDRSPAANLAAPRCYRRLFQTAPDRHGNTEPRTRSRAHAEQPGHNQEGSDGNGNRWDVASQSRPSGQKRV